MHAALLLYLQSGVPARFPKAKIVPKQPSGKRAITIRIAQDLATLLEAEAIRDGQGRESGRVYSPSATIERILREYFDARPKRNLGRSR